MHTVCSCRLASSHSCSACCVCHAGSGWMKDQSYRSIYIARTIIRNVYKYVYTFLCVQVSVGMQTLMKCDSVSQCSCLQSCAVHFLDQVVDGDASVQGEAWNGAQNMGRGGGEHHRNWLCIIRRVNSDVFPGGIYLTPPGLFSVLYWKLCSYTTLIWATFCSGTPFSLSLLSPVQAALQGDHYHSQKEHVGSSLWRRPERPTETLAGQTCWNQRAHPFSLWTHFPCTLTEWDCEWEQCVSYPLTTVRVTDSTSSRVQHVQSTHENHASIRATHSKVITKPFKISICVVRTSTKLLLFHFTLWALWWLCHELVPWTTQCVSC